MTQQDLIKMVRKVQSAADPLKEIERVMGEAVGKEIGATVEVTFYAKSQLSMCAYSEATLTAADKVMKQAGLSEIDRIDCFSDDGYGFVYYSF
jgi:hypothetical protein